MPKQSKRGNSKEIESEFIVLTDLLLEPTP